MAHSPNSTPTSPPSSSDTIIMRHQAATALILADLLAMQLRSPHALRPTKSGPKPPWFSMASLKSLIDYIGAAHKLVLLWRAISFGYIGRELLKWAGWL